MRPRVPASAPGRVSPTASPPPPLLAGKWRVAAQASVAGFCERAAQDPVCSAAEEEKLLGLFDAGQAGCGLTKAWVQLVFVETRWVLGTSVWISEPSLPSSSVTVH